MYQGGYVSEISLDGWFLSAELFQNMTERSKLRWNRANG